MAVISSKKTWRTFCHLGSEDFHMHKEKFIVA